MKTRNVSRRTLQEKLCIYYIEYQDTVKFFNGENSLELIREDNLLQKFLKAAYKKYGKMIKFESLM